jgi:hypothetical protein
MQRPDCSFRTGSNLIAPAVAELIAELIHFDGAAAKARPRLGTLPADIFGDIFANHPPARTDAIKANRQGEGFLRVRVDQPPILLIASVDLGTLPFEMFFPDKLVVRAPSYSSLVLRLAAVPSSVIPVPVLLRHPLDSFKAACGRAVDVVGYVMHDLCDGPAVPPAAPGERYSPLASILFKAGKTTDAVQKKWQFARVIEQAPKWSEFFIFSYADLAEMNAPLRGVLGAFPAAFCMFVPGAYMKEAFQILAKLYRLSGRMGGKGATLSLTQQTPFETTYQFIVSIQRMLMRLLKVPIPLFVHL